MALMISFFVQGVKHKIFCYMIKYILICVNLLTKENASVLEYLNLRAQEYLLVAKTSAVKWNYGIVVVIRSMLCIKNPADILFEILDTIEYWILYIYLLYIHTLYMLCSFEW